ncbi:MAG: sulfatase-like hydrolase/transferase [Anaerolineae bacterium]
MPDQPNVLLIMSDQMKATASHLWANSFCETPSLARLAREGVLFENAFTTHPLCVPARTSLWTSMYPHSTGCRRNETLMPPDAIHAFKLWHAAGYHTGLIGKDHCFAAPEDLDLFDVRCDQGHIGVEGDRHPKGLEWWRPIEAIRSANNVRRTMQNQSPRFGYAVNDAPLEDQTTGLLAGQAIRYLETFGDQPFALWVSFPDPHEPYVAPRSYAERFPRDVIELPPRREGEFSGPGVPERNRVLHEILGTEDDSLDDVCGVMACYYGMVRFLDDGVGQILDALDRLELWRNTIVVFCADHGDFMGEHRMTCKGGVFYDCLTHVPLVVSWPGHMPAGERDDSLVSLIDIVPTLLQLQGIQVPRSMQGKGLPRCTDTPPRDAAFAEYGAGGSPFTMADLAGFPKPYGRRALMASLRRREAEGRRKMVRTRDWKYVHDPMGDLDELYDLVNDPWELTNVVGEPGHAAVVADMQRRLADWSIITEDARPVPLP